MIIYHLINILGKKLIKGLKNRGGRNLHGRVCIYGRGGGNKRKYRIIDFIRRLNCYGRIIRIYKDPIRSAKICLILYSNGFITFSLLQKNIKVNDEIYSGSIYDKMIDSINNGYSLLIKYMPLFSPLSNIEFKPLEGSKIVRAASVSSIIISKNDYNSILKLNSK